MDDGSGQQLDCGPLGDMSDDPRPANPLFTRDSPIMRPQSFNRGENCADLAIPLIAAGGCRAVSAGVLARLSGVTPPAVAKWFGSTAQMWEALADVIGRRWISCLDSSSRLDTAAARAPRWTDLDVFQAASLFLPVNQDEIEWARVWLSMLELGRHHELVGRQMARCEGREREVLHRATGCRDAPTLSSTMVLVRGLRQMVAATHEPLYLATAHTWLHLHVQSTYVEHGIPEPTTEDDALPSTQRFTYLRPTGSG